MYINYDKFNTIFRKISSKIVLSIPVLILDSLDMSYVMSVTFLGTSSGGGPNDTRSCSSLALEIRGNGDIWRKYCHLACTYASLKPNL